LPQRLRDAVKVAVCGRAACVELTAPRLGKDARIAVSQDDDGALNQPLGPRVSLLIKSEAVFQCLVHNFLHPSIHRRVNPDPSLQKVFHAKVSTADIELFKDAVNDRARLWHFVLFGGLAGIGRCPALFAPSTEIKPFAAMSARV